MSQSQNAETDGSTANPTRRKFIKGITIGSGVAATGGLSTQTRFSPMGRSEAVIPAVALVGGGLIAGGVARYGYEQYINDSSGDVDENDTLENQAYSQAISNEIAFEQRRDNLAKKNRTQRFKDSLWSEVRAAGARTYETDGSATAAIENANERMEEVLNNRIVNIIRAWNAEMGSAQSVLQLKAEQGITNVNGSGTSTLSEASPSDNFSTEYHEDFSQFSTSVEDVYYGAVATMDGLLRGGEKLDVYFQFGTGGGNISHSSPVYEAELADGSSGETITRQTATDVLVDDPGSNQTATLIAEGPYFSAIADTFTAYNSVKSDAETYLNNLETGYEKGTVDSSSVLTGRELMEEQGYVDENGNVTEEYEGATDEERLAAESIASGMGAPDDAGVRARVNHASLSSERTGNLFIDFAGNGGSLTVGEIPAADYNYAIMGVTYDDGSFGVETLESEADDGTAQPIEVLEVIGAEEREFSYTDEEITVGTGGDVVVYEGTDPPKELANPSEYQGFEIDIDTPNSSASVPIADVTESGSQYIAPTSLTEGETVDSITFRAPVSYEEYSSYSQGDTTVDLERLQEQEDVISRQQEQLEELQNQGGGGGGGFLPDVSVDSNSTIIAAVAVVLVAFGLLGNN